VLPYSKNIYYVYPSIFPLKWCEEVIQLGRSRKTFDATIGTTEGHKVRKEVRATSVCFLDEKSIYRPAHRVLDKANEDAKWGFQYDFTERTQFTVYNTGHFYDWHQDSWDSAYTEEGPIKGKIRKLSMIIILSDEDEYEGGDLYLKDYALDNGIHKFGKLPKGTAIVFPSFIYHKVDKITSGTRMSLVNWTCGDPFK